MTNKKSITIIFVTVLFALFIVAGIPAVSMSSEATTDKEVKEEQPIKPDKEVKQEKQEQKAQEIKSAVQPETKPKFKMGKEVKEQDNPYAKAEIAIKTIPSANNTFGYDILLQGKPLVHQPSIPGLPGNNGFTTRERAQKVAEFVVKKIRNNEMPPTVTIDDLNNMGVLK